ncbi:hypothetical protein SLOPH_1065 [Spraguea lophii 42_110]|uniref:Uncharacterized protein n=1 Tax=Spraguea lophii (strain 42_110) TaxID=1358809 RepID=S7W731_SPRLO|nr:hypothetical protein SLOPH_1065 [Spraguea lophii 42_110]
MVYLYLLFYFIFSTNQKYHSTDLKDDLEFNNIVSDVKNLIGRHQNGNKDIIKLQILSICTAAQTDLEYTEKKVNEILEMSKDIKEIDFIKNIIKDLMNMMP